MANNKALKVVEPEIAVQVSTESVDSQKESAPVDAVQAEDVNKIYEFVKNINPNEKIVFEDGTDFVMPRGKTLYVTADEVLAQKLIKVAERYSIFLR